eukprot:11004191-Karenia_brevis.AAC.1
MGLLEFLRKSNVAGDIIHWVKDKHAAQENDPGGVQDVVAFANQCSMSGEKLIAMSMKSRFNEM